MDECIANVCCAPDLAKSTLCTVPDTDEKIVLPNIYQHLTAGVPDI